MIRSRPAFCLRLPATPLSARTARQGVREFARRAGIGGLRLDEVELAVAEACANAVVHGLSGGRQGTFKVTGVLCGDAVVIRTIDTGLGMDGAQDSVGLGLGIPLIDALSDSVSYGTPEGGGTEVRMTFMVRPDGRRRRAGHGPRGIDRRVAPTQAGC